jgi:murein DD-endopeptidase MepM/ murein hydrolase activator NlpD
VLKDITGQLSLSISASLCNKSLNINMDGFVLKKDQFSISSPLQPFQRLFLFGIFFIFAGLCFFNTPDKSGNILTTAIEIPINPIVNTVITPTQSTTLTEPEVQTDTASRKTTLTPQILSVRSGDSLTAIFQRVHLPRQLAIAILKNPQAAHTLKHIKQNQHITFFWDGENQLHQMVYDIDPLNAIIIDNFNGNTFSVHEKKAVIQTFPVFRSGTIKRNLNETFRTMNLTTKQQQMLMKIFSEQINFSRDIRHGDEIKVLFEEKTTGGQLLGPGDILAAVVKLKNHVYTAIRFKLPHGGFDYFTEKGESLKHAFDRYPVAFSRISAPFTTYRYHPILHFFRRHEGVDLAAHYGTPIHAAANGKVVLRGQHGGYGQTIVLDHGSQVSTLYAHMSRFAKNVYPGKEVQRGEVIGYVGSSGLATGPHLHYEFRINGQHYDPVHVVLPHTTNALPRTVLAQFKIRAQEYLQQMRRFERI